jgi:hypothetical protein
LVFLGKCSASVYELILLEFVFIKCKKEKELKKPKELVCSLVVEHIPCNIQGPGFDSPASEGGRR